MPQHTNKNTAKYYAGIGSRNTPSDILGLMTRIAMKLSRQGWVLRSGCAGGADQAFAEGADDAQIFLPWSEFGKNWQEEYSHHEYFTVDSYDKEAADSVEKFHPNPNALSLAGRSFMRRNYRQIIGRKGESNSAFVLCWTPNGSGEGGTGQAIRIAKHFNIPIIDLGTPNIAELFE